MHFVMQMASHAFNTQKTKCLHSLTKNGHLHCVDTSLFQLERCYWMHWWDALFHTRGEARAEQMWSARWFPFVIEPLELESLREKQLVKILHSQTRNRGPKSNLFLPLWVSAANNSLAARWVKFLTSADLIPVTLEFSDSRGKLSEQRCSLFLFKCFNI